MAKGKQQSNEQDSAETARDRQRDMVEPRFMIDGKDVTQVRYAIKLDQERLNAPLKDLDPQKMTEAERQREYEAASKSIIESADVRFFKGRKEVAAFVGLTADELEKLVGKHNRTNIENGVGRGQRNQPIDGIAGKLEGDYLVSNRATSAGLEDKAVKQEPKQSMTAALGELDQIMVDQTARRNASRAPVGKDEAVLTNGEVQPAAQKVTENENINSILIRREAGLDKSSPLFSSEIAEWARKDVQALNQINDPEQRQVATAIIAGIAQEKLAYRAVLSSDYPAIAQQVQQVNKDPRFDEEIAEFKRRAADNENISSMLIRREAGLDKSSPLFSSEIAEWARKDVQALNQINDPEQRQVATAIIAGIAQEKLAYRAVLSSDYPAIAQQVQQVNKDPRFDEEIAEFKRRAADNENISSILIRREAGLDKSSPLFSSEIAEWARKDVQALNQINDPEQRQVATAIIAGIAQEKLAYRAVLSSDYPAIAQQVQQVNKDPRFDGEIAKFEPGIDTGKITVDRTVGQDASRSPVGKGETVTNEQYEKTFREFEAQAQPGTSGVETKRAGATTERGGQNSDLSEVNSIEHDNDRVQVHPKMDDEVRRNVASMWLNHGNQVEQRRSPEQANDGLPPRAEPRGAAHADLDDSRAPGAEAKPAVRVIPKEIEDSYLRVGNKFHYTDKPKLQAFEDKGEKLETKSNSERIAADLVAIAAARGWDSIKVKGSEEFRQRVWLEASLQGLAVKGYKPTEADQALLEKRERTSTANAVLRDDSVQKRLTPSVDVTKAATDREQSSTGERNAAPAGDKTQAASAERAARSDRDAPSPAAKPERGALTGTLLEHGKAKFNFDKDEKPNYYVKYRDDQGTEKITWGVGLEKAMKESKAEVGQRVEMTNKGPEAVRVLANVRDANGKVVGQEEITTHRNKWEVKAEAFRSQDPKEAVKTHPDLVNAYALVRAAEVVATQKFPAAEDQKRFVDMMRESVAKSIEQNRAIPEVMVRDKQQQQVSQQKREIAADKALER